MGFLFLLSFFWFDIFDIAKECRWKGKLRGTTGSEWGRKALVLFRVCFFLFDNTSGDYFYILIEDYDQRYFSFYLFYIFFFYNSWRSEIVR